MCFGGLIWFGLVGGILPRSLGALGSPAIEMKAAACFGAGSEVQHHPTLALRSLLVYFKVY